MTYRYNSGFVPTSVFAEPFAIPQHAASKTDGRSRLQQGVAFQIPGDARSISVDDPYYEFSDLQGFSKLQLSDDDPYYEFSNPSASSLSMSVFDDDQPYYEFENRASAFDEMSPYLSSELPEVRLVCDSVASNATLVRPLKVIHAGPHLSRGGAEQWLIDLAKAIDPAQIKIVRHVAVNPKIVDPDYVAELADCGVTIEAGGTESLTKAAEEADVLLSWGVELHRYLKRRPRAISVQVVHGDGPWNRYFLERSRHCVDHAVAVSHRVQRRICFGVPSTVIYNGIDAVRLARKHSRDEVRSRLKLKKDDFVVGFFGRLASEKRVTKIIEAVALLPANVKVLFVGKGPLEAELRQMADEQICGRSRFTVADGDIGDLYSAVDTVCLASNQEGFSLVMLEAMLSERPVLSTPVGSACEVIEDRINGLLHDGTPTGLAAAIDKLIRFPAWGSAVATEGRRRAEQFGYSSRMARDYTHLLTNLLKRRQRTS